MPTIDLARMTTQERIDLLKALWDSLAGESADLTPAQEAELARRAEAFGREHDLWARPFLDEATAEIERGEVVTLDDAEAHLAAKFGPRSR